MLGRGRQRWAEADADNIGKTLLGRDRGNEQGDLQTWILVFTPKPLTHLQQHSLNSTMARQDLPSAAPGQSLAQSLAIPEDPTLISTAQLLPCPL